MPLRKSEIHMHSIFSDGEFSPSELINLAEKNKVSVLSLTDHDTFDGIPEFLQFAETTENWLFPEAPRLRFPRNQEFLSNALIKISRTCIPR